jgi:hypothetical protein
MKKLIQIASLFLILALVFTSCAKEEIDAPLSLEQSFDVKQISEPSTSIDLNVDVENGLVKFTTLNQFLDALEYLSDNPERYFTDDALSQWEASQGFSSLREKESQILDEFENLSTETDFTALSEKYFEYDFSGGDFKLQVNHSMLPYVLNRGGNVLIGTSLHHFTGNKQIIIADRSIEKLERAKNTLISDTDEGIYVFDFNNEQASLRADCGTIRICEFKSNGNSSGSKRVNSTHRVSYFTNVIWGSNGLPAFFTHGHTFSSTLTSKRKTIFSWVKNHDDDLQFGVGYDVESNIFGNMAHGTGWTSNSWRINYSRRCYPIQSVSSLPPVVNFQFTVINSVVSNTFVPIQCDDNCN